MEDVIEVVGAREHNLKNIDVQIPKNKLVVITGISGSGKSSLAFDTLYAEGQRRYMETFGAYARQFIGKMDRPDVEHIHGLSPVISIEQKTTGWNPRSTVGTITEIYDFLRLLYARIGEAYSYATGKRMIRFSEEEIINHILDHYRDKKIVILAPVVRGRKGHYREMFDQIRKQGYAKVRVDGKLLDLEKGLQVERFKTHDIEIVVDRLKIDIKKRDRLSASLYTALKLGDGLIMILDYDTGEVSPFSKNLMDPESGISYEEPSPNAFSFNSPYGACPTCGGMGKISVVDPKKVIPDPRKSINQVGIVPFGEVRDNFTFKQLRAIAKKFKFSFATPIDEIPTDALSTILEGGDDSFDVRMPYSKHDFTYNLANEGLYRMLDRWYNDTSSEKVRQWAEAFMTVTACHDCQGQRLKKESRQFKIAGQNIAELAALDLQELHDYFATVESKLSKKQLTIGKDVLKEIKLRLKFLLHVGLDYLSLDRPARSLSGGESQRTRLANQIGSQLTGITYILDEPSIGLHQRDNQRLIASLKELTEIGNTVLVVEHDKDIMLASDYLIDLGPGAGEQGGDLVAQGVPKDLIKKQKTLTSDYLSNRQMIALPETRRKGNGHFLKLKGAQGHNLKNVQIKIPLGTFTCVTGVSGSGKSTLINETLYPILRKHFHRSKQDPLPYDALDGLEHLDKVIEIDQAPIGRTPRSNPATYTGVFTDIRKLYAEVPESKIRGYKPGRFSFNVKGGRCETCQGGGMRVIEMNFLPNVMVECETCQGRRYNRETLEIIFKGKSISQVLAMSVREAVEFFKNIPRIYRILKTLNDVGLGYITLGQSATTLSGGEAQRVKLSEELAKRDTGSTMYILDEPTTGLHFDDIRQLLTVLNKLVEKGNTVIVIEHNMDVIKVADYMLDVGPEGGRRGGQIVAHGTPEAVARDKKSMTGAFLKKELALLKRKKKSTT
ncbi:MAG: excinuclease ABC subunit UvrA [Saprospiraceae bacterium]|nr:excinuclease ABC subunit UvrA [Saprospiraceae bacterium]